MVRLRILSEEEIIEINKKFNGVAKKGDLNFIVSRMKSAKLTDDIKKDVAKAAATVWFYIIQNHVFLDGNKRTATEAAKLLCDINSFGIDLPPNGFIYISLRIANNDINFQELIDFIYKKLRRSDT